MVKLADWEILHEMSKPYLHQLQVAGIEQQKSLINVMIPVIYEARFTLTLLEIFLEFLATATEKESITQGFAVIRIMMHVDTTTIHEYFLENCHHFATLVSLMIGNETIRANAVAILYNIADSQNERLHKLLFEHTRFLELVREIFSHPTDASSIVECLKVLYTIALKDAARILENVQVVQMVVEIMKSELVSDTWRVDEMAAAIIIISWPNVKCSRIQQIIENGVIEALCESLKMYIYQEYIALALKGVLEAGNSLVDGENVLFNPVALRIAECGILHKIQAVDTAKNTKIIDQYFGESYEQYLARRRGLKTKKAI